MELYSASHDSTDTRWYIPQLAASVCTALIMFRRVTWKINKRHMESRGAPWGPWSSAGVNG